MTNALFGTHWTLPIPMFGLFVAAAIATSAWVTHREVHRYESEHRLPSHTHAHVSDLILIATLVGLVGARVFHILEYPNAFAADPLAMIFTRSGFSIFGGLCFGIVAGVIFLKRHSIPVVPMLDACTPALVLGYAIGRLGCQVAGDGDWGTASDMALKPTWLPDWLWAQTYDGNILGVTLPPPGVYPTPLYESAMAVLVLGVLWLLRSPKRRAGFLFSIYLLLMGFERLLIEKIRVNVDYHLWGLAFTQAEAVAFVMIVVGSAGVLITEGTRRLLPKLVFSVTVLAALSACVVH